LEIHLILRANLLRLFLRIALYLSGPPLLSLILSSHLKVTTEMAGGGGGVGGRLDSCMKADVWVMVTLSGSILLSLFNRSKGSKPEKKQKKILVILMLNMLTITVLSIIYC